MDKNYLIRIEGLNESITSEDIRKKLSEYVNVLVIRTESGTNNALAQIQSSGDVSIILNQIIEIKGVQLSIIFLDQRMQSDNNKQSYVKTHQEIDFSNKNTSLFIKGIPPHTKHTIISDYLSYFGKMNNLIIKKHLTEDKNLGYGFVEYFERQSVDKILEQQQIKGGQLTIPSTDIQLQFEETAKISQYQENSIIVDNFYENPIHLAEEIAEKEEKAVKALSKVKERLLEENAANKIEINVQFNNETNNFNASINFEFKTDEQEEKIFNLFRDCIFDNFIYSDGMTIPAIKFYHTANSSKRLIFIGLKDFVNSNILSKWITEKVGIKVEQRQIIFLNNGEQKVKRSCKAVVYLDTEQDSEKILDTLFESAEKQDILVKNHKITIYLKQSELKNIQSRVSNVKNYYKYN